MRIRFTWQPDEWHEAVQLATTPPRTKRDVPYMVYGVLGIMSLGGVGDALHALQVRQGALATGPMLAGGAGTLAAGGGLVWLTRFVLRKRRLKRLPPVPEGEQQVIFQETGWSTAPGPMRRRGDLNCWDELHTARSGNRSLVVLGTGSTFAAVPLRAMSNDEGEHLQRLLARKLRPVLQDEFASTAAAASSY